MGDFTDRTERLIGAQKLALIRGATIAVFGLGGVGSYALEAIARAGAGSLIIADYDRVDITNINRQLLALHSTVGMLKTELAAMRIAQINPDCTVHTYPIRISADTLPLLDRQQIDIAVDCIDSVENKIELLAYLYNRSIPTVSSMGAAQKSDPSQITTQLIEKTRVCPLARKIRKSLREREISGTIYAVSSTEKGQPGRDGPLGTLPYMPGLFGLHCAAAAMALLTGGTPGETLLQE